MLHVTVQLVIDTQTSKQEITTPSDTTKTAQHHDVHKTVRLRQPSDGYNEKHGAKPAPVNVHCKLNMDYLLTTFHTQ